MFPEAHPSVGSEGRNKKCLSLPISPRSDDQVWHEEIEEVPIMNVKSLLKTHGQVNGAEKQLIESASMFL